MVSFSIPTGKTADTFFNFTVENRCLLFAGSRNFELNPSLCSHLINSFGKLGFSFLTGCASGVDKSFRYALSTSSYSKNSIVACAFKYRLKDPSGLCSLLVVPDNLNPKVALAKRTLWMTSRCSLLVLFPDFPCGSGSRLAFKSAIMNNKPVFVASQVKPKDSNLYNVYKDTLFGLVSGFWCVPPVYKDGLCYELY